MPGSKSQWENIVTKIFGQSKYRAQQNRLKGNYPDQATSLSCIGTAYYDPYVQTPAYSLVPESNNSLDFVKKATKLYTVDLLNPSDVNNIGRRAYRWLKEDKYIVYQDLIQKAAGIFSLIWGILTLIFIMWEFKSGCELKYDESIAETAANPEIAKLQINKLNNALSSKWYKPLKNVCLSFIYFGTFFQLFKRTTSINKPMGDSENDNKNYDTKTNIRTYNIGTRQPTRAWE